MHIAPPNILGLRFRPARDPAIVWSVIPVTNPFCCVIAGHPFPAGFTYEHVDEPIGKDGKIWSQYAIAFRSADANADELAAWMASASAASEVWTTAKAEETRQHRQEIADRSGPLFAAEVAAVRAEAEAMLQEWGLALHRPAQLRELLDTEVMLHGEVRQIRELLQKSRSQIKEREAAAKLADVPSLECSDEVAEEAIRTLTALDADHSTEANRAGWGRSTTIGGHWCNAMLSRDRALALREGRRLIVHGKHQRQLKKLGIDVGVAA